MVAETFSGTERAPASRIDWLPVRRIVIGVLLMAAFSATGAILLLIVTAIQLQNASRRRSSIRSRSRPAGSARTSPISTITGRR